MTNTSKASGDTFEARIVEEYGELRIRRGAFGLGTDLAEKKRIIDALKDLEGDHNVKALLVFNDEDAFTAEEHARYEASLHDLREARGPVAANMKREREDHAFDQYLSTTMRFRKPIVSCLSGEIAAPFFGLHLSSDVRLVQTSVRFRLSHVEQGVLPTSGLCYLLPLYVGRGRAAEWLLSGGEIAADEAKAVGLVNDVLGPADFDVSCRRWVQAFFERGSRHVEATRRLLYHDVDGFSAFMRRELAIRRQEFNRSDT